MTHTVPSSAKLTRPWSKAASHKRREQQPVVDVEPLLVVAVGPGHDVRGAQQRGFGDAGERAAAAPIIHQGIPEHVLPNALDHQALGLGGAREARGLGVEAMSGASGRLTASL